MSMTRQVAKYVLSQPDRCATRAELQAAFRNHPRLKSALYGGARNGWLRRDGTTWRHTGVEMLSQGWLKGVLRNDPEGDDQKCKLRFADEHFARLIGDLRYEDVANIGPRIAWLSLPPAPPNAISCSAAMLVGQRQR